MTRGQKIWIGRCTCMWRKDEKAYLKACRADLKCSGEVGALVDDFSPPARLPLLLIDLEGLFSGLFSGLLLGRR